jgi:predicted transglutaminase-like cysteine proteinase
MLPDADKKPKGFEQLELEDTIPGALSLDQPMFDPAPEINTSKSCRIDNIVVSWYFEKNTVYTNFGGTIKVFVQNNGTYSIYVYRIGIKPTWEAIDIENVTSDNIVYSRAGKFINSGEKEYLGMIYFPGPSWVDDFEYTITFSAYHQNESGIWNDCGVQTGNAKIITVADLPIKSEYKQHYNVRQYYDKINEIVEPTNKEVIKLSRTIAGEYPGPFNINQVCAIFDYVNAHIKYISDPSSTENYWCTPEQTLELGGDCEDFSTLLASMIISIGGSVRMYLTDSHAFVSVYLGNVTTISSLTAAIEEFYHADLQLFWFEDELGLWLILDSIGSLYPGGLPLGAAPEMKIFNADIESYSWRWEFTETESLHIIDVIPK